MKDFDYIFDQIDAAVAPERFTNSLEFGKILDEKGACSALMFRPEYSTEPLFASIKEPTLMEFDLGENGVYLSSDRKHCLYIKNQQIILMESTVVPETINYVKRNARIGAAIGVLLATVIFTLWFRPDFKGVLGNPTDGFIILG